MTQTTDPLPPELTRQQFHEWWRTRRHTVGVWVECSCGHAELVDEARLAEVLAQHKPGTWA